MIAAFRYVIVLVIFDIRGPVVTFAESIKGRLSPPQGPDDGHLQVKTLKMLGKGFTVSYEYINTCS